MKPSTGTNGRKLDDTRDFLRNFYGKAVQKTQDLQFNSCCTDETQSRFYEILELVPEEVKSRQYGCGSPIPHDNLSGLTVVDLGSGAGTDTFIVSKLVGPKGKVIGIDMTEEQLEIARRNTPVISKKFNFQTPNIEFIKDYIETAEAIPSGSVDLVISNCVINLSPLKEQVFKTIWRMLKHGGEFYTSDIVCDRRLPDEIRQNKLLYSECLSGAEYYNDLIDIMESAGFRDVREFSKHELEDRVGTENAKFCSVTLRGFKLPELDRRCEDYGQFAEYIGNCNEQPVEFNLDGGHIFEAKRPVAVCRNTALMLTKTRLMKYFNVTEEKKHFGLFDCTPALEVKADKQGNCC